MKVKKLMTEPVFYINSKQSLAEAARLMWEHDCGAIPVVDSDNQVVGMLTDRDIAMAAYINGSTLGAIPVSLAQSKKLVSCKADDEIETVQKKMRTEQVHRIPVIGDELEPLGLISLNDLACAYKAGTKDIKSEAISDTLAAICSAMKAGKLPTNVIAA